MTSASGLASQEEHDELDRAAAVAQEQAERIAAIRERDEPTWATWLKERIIALEAKVDFINGNAREFAAWKAKQEGEAAYKRYIREGFLIVGGLLGGYLGHRLGAW